MPAKAPGTKEARVDPEDRLGNCREGLKMVWKTVRASWQRGHAWLGTAGHWGTQRSRVRPSGKGPEGCNARSRGWRGSCHTTQRRPDGHICGSVWKEELGVPVTTLQLPKLGEGMLQKLGAWSLGHAASQSSEGLAFPPPPGTRENGAAGGGGCDEPEVGRKPISNPQPRSVRV